MQEIKQKTGRDALSTAYFGTMYRNRDINNCIQRFRACLKNHSYNLHAPICGKNAKESKKVIRRMDKARKSSKDSYNIK